MRYVVCAALTLTVLSSAPASGALISTSPSVVCSYLNDSGLRTRGWKNYYGSEYGCSSPYRELGTGYPLANNLAFYAEGTGSEVTSTKLVLNVNNRGTAEAAKNELLKAAKLLSVKAAGGELPQSVQDAISAGEGATASVGSVSVEVLRIDWPTGKGYEIKVILE